MKCKPLVATQTYFLRRNTLRLAVAALAVTPTSFAASVPLGAEFRVNTVTASTQAVPAIATDAFGNFVVVWESLGQDGDAYGVFGQRYDSSGIPRGTEFQVNSIVADDQRNPAVAMDTDGDFVVTWEGEDPETGRTAIFAQRINAEGSFVGSEFRVNTFSSFKSSPSVAMYGDGDFIITWDSSAQDGSSNGVYAQRYNGVGAPQGSEFRVNTTTFDSQRDPVIAADADGDFVIAWESDNQDGANAGIFAQRFDNRGVRQGSEFGVNTFTVGFQRYPDVAMDADGDFVVSWNSSNQIAGSYVDVYAQRYTRVGVREGGEFLVNTVTVDSQENPAISMDADGDFVIAWQSLRQDGVSGFGVYAQRYNSLGIASGNEIFVNTFTSSSQRLPDVALDADGDFVVVWQSYNQDGAFSEGVYGQRFRSNETLDLFTSLDGSSASSIGGIVPFVATISNLRPPASVTGLPAIDGAIGSALGVSIGISQPKGASIRGVPSLSVPGSCVLVRKAYECSLDAPLRAGQQARISYSVRFKKAGTRTSTATTTTQSFDTNSTNDRAQVTTTVQ